jgi:hypothetical protein
VSGRVGEELLAVVVSGLPIGVTSHTSVAAPVPLRL